jgi:beta-glucosidase
MIRGVQGHGVATTIKDFVADEQETARFTVNETKSERALMDIYLRPFEIAIKDSNPWAVMTTYNHINGVHYDANKWLLQYVLRDQWGLNGLVLSGRGGKTTVADSIGAHVDFERPGSPHVRKLDKVSAAIDSGLLTDQDLDNRVKALLVFLHQLGASLLDTGTTIV